jgi:16S rRNA (cytidine1402-2'-O)-methyltransferase
MAAGTLFVVATPIGNLEDITLRALRVLREVDLIAAEDTRRTAKLLTHYGIHRPVRSLHEHNEWKEADRLVAELQGGSNVALVSDAGTPGIADPGSILVDRCLRAGIKVSPIPGPSAVMAALSVSGIDASTFVFAGFPPRSGQDRDDWFDALSQERRPVVFFEAPHRVERTLADGSHYWSDRQLLMFREISKINEELVIRPQVSKNGATMPRGEIVVVVGPINTGANHRLERERSAGLAADLFGCLTAKCEMGRDTAIELAAKAYAVSPAALAKSLKKRRIAEKQARDRLS